MDGTLLVEASCLQPQVSQTVSEFCLLEALQWYVCFRVLQSRTFLCVQSVCVESVCV